MLWCVTFDPASSKMSQCPYVGLLRTAAAFSELRLTICSANSSRRRGFSRTPARRYALDVQEAITARVQNFRGNCASSAVVRVDLDNLEPKPVEKSQLGAEKDVVCGYQQISAPDGRVWLMF